MLLPLFLISCLNKDNNIVSLLKEWEQKEILFPKEMYFTTMLRDTTYYNLQSEYKILAYVDSIGCTSCKLQLSAWSMLINEIDSLYADRVKFIFAFSPNRIKDINHAILTANFTYPVYVDKQDSIDFIERQPVFHLAFIPGHNGTDVPLPVIQHFGIFPPILVLNQIKRSVLSSISQPKMLFSSSGERNGESITATNRHFGHSQHQIFFLLPLLQLRNIA